MIKLILLSFVIILIFSVKIKPQNPFWEQYCFNDTMVTQLEIDREENFYAVVGDYPGPLDLFISTDGSLTWELIFSQIPLGSCYWHYPILLIDTTNQGYDKIYVNCLDSLFYSIDKGSSWNILSLPADLFPTSRICEMAYNSIGDLYLATYKRLHVTTDNGTTWQLLVNGSQNGWELTRIVVDLVDNIYTNDKGHTPPSAPWEVIYKSANNGLTWEGEISSEEFFTFRSSSSGELYAGIGASMFLKIPSNQDWIFYENLACIGKMAINKFKYMYLHSMYSPDYGTNWFRADNSSLAIYDIVIDSEGYLYGTSNTAIYKSVESTFPIVNSEIFEFPETAVNDTSSVLLIFFNPYSSQLIVDSVSSSKSPFFYELSFPIVLNTGDSLISTLYFSPEEIRNYEDIISVYSNFRSHKLRLTGIGQNPTNIENNQNLITEFRLSQNYPNPFNPATTITYQIPERSFVTLKVYDVLGNEVATLISEEKPAGSYEIEWIASDLPSGIYFYQLRANNFVEIKKMVFMK